MEFGISGCAISTRAVSSKPSSAGLSTRPILPAIKQSPRTTASVQRRPSGDIPQPETTVSPRVRESSGKKIMGVAVKGSENILHSRGGSRDTKQREPVGAARNASDKPLKMQRAKRWSPEVENLFRYQAAGFRDENEYVSMYDMPEEWESSGFVKCLQVKTNGYFMYFRQDRECEDKYLNKIKIYSY